MPEEQWFPTVVADVAKMNGSKKAGLWLLSVDRDLALSILKHMDRDEVCRIQRTMEEAPRAAPEQLAAIHAEFGSAFRRHSVRLRGKGNYLTQLATEVYGADPSAALPPPAEADEAQEAAPTISRSEAEAFAATLRREHPQVIAAVLAKFDPAISGEILRSFEVDDQTDIVGRIARLGQVDSAALEHAERILAAGLPRVTPQKPGLDGVSRAAGILNRIAGDDAEDILEKIEDTAEETAKALRRAMFTFEDLVALDSRGFQSLLTEVSNDQLLLALKTASDEMLGKIFSSLSKRAGEMLRDDLEVMAPVRLAEVETAQQAIVSVALKLSAEGKLAIAGQGEEYV